VGSATGFVLDRVRKNWPEARTALLGGLPPFVLARRPRPLGHRVPAFYYHLVDTETLEGDLRFLDRNGYVGIDADTLLDHLEGRRRAPDRAVVLTFDDGPRNLHQVAFPLLRAYAQRAVAFIAPRFHADEAPDVPDRPCTWGELAEMHASGLVDVQSHTFEHRYVPGWPEPLALTGVAPRFAGRGTQPLTMAEDFRLARETIEARLGKRVRHLAFPRFDATPEAERIARDCGYAGLWRGMVPRRPINAPGEGGGTIVRAGGELARRLPGSGRATLAATLRRRSAAGLLSRPA
jgi:peptidoglycan/xylan/chitin deacetylase (PgdA/CDA1 family)